jgi:hypothetical protein
MAPVAPAERLTVIDGLAGWSIEGLWRAAVSPAGLR